VQGSRSGALGETGRTIVTHQEADSHTLREAAEAEELRDADSSATAAAFEQDSSDTFSKLARSETSIERSLLSLAQPMREGRPTGARFPGKNVATPHISHAGANKQRPQ